MPVHLKLVPSFEEDYRRLVMYDNAHSHTPRMLQPIRVDDAQWYANVARVHYFCTVVLQISRTRTSELRVEFIYDGVRLFHVYYCLLQLLTLLHGSDYHNF